MDVLGDAAGLLEGELGLGVTVGPGGSQDEDAGSRHQFRRTKRAVGKGRWAGNQPKKAGIALDVARARHDNPLL
jgi:hypothetical protein